MRLSSIYGGFWAWSLYEMIEGWIDGSWDMHVTTFHHQHSYGRRKWDVFWFVPSGLGRWVARRLNLRGWVQGAE